MLFGLLGYIFVLYQSVRRSIQFCSSTLRDEREHVKANDIRCYSNLLPRKSMLSSTATPSLPPGDVHFITSPSSGCRAARKLFARRVFFKVAVFEVFKRRAGRFSARALRLGRRRLAAHYCAIGVRTRLTSPLLCVRNAFESRRASTPAFFEVQLKRNE